MLKIAVIVGSLRKDSINRQLAKGLETLAAGKMTFDFVSIGDLPLFNQDFENPLPAPVTVLKNAVQAADGVLFVTPEYNRGIPGPLKNAIDWGSRPYGQSCWPEKPAAICGASPGPIGASIAQNQLRTMIAGHMNMPTLGQPEMYIAWKDGMVDANGHFTDEKTRAFMQGFVDKFHGWVALHSAAQKQKAA
jgi:chromate reductase